MKIVVKTRGSVIEIPVKDLKEALTIVEGFRKVFGSLGSSSMIIEISGSSEAE